MMEGSSQMPGTSGRRMTRVRTLGRGASGAVVSLFAAGDGEGDELLAVKSAGAATGGAALLRREGGILASLCSPYVLPCLGSRAAAGGQYQLFLEFAPGGSLADEVERRGGRLEERAVRAYAADVARGLAYLHGESMVHGDVKGRNVVIGADGWAKLADFGCARSVGSAGPIGGTPAFMAPEVARGEEQGPAADVWALGCTVIEMATGRAPWGHMADVVAAVRLIGYTDAVPEAPERLSAEAKDFLGKCLTRCAGERWTAAQLLEHPFLAFAGCGADVEAADLKGKWVSPKSTLDAAMWESDADEDDKAPDDDDTAERMKSLAASYSVLPDWESDDGWIDVMSCHSEVPESAVAETPAEPSSSEAPGSLPAEEINSDEVLRVELGVEEAVVVSADVPVAAAPPEETVHDYDGGLDDQEGSLLLEAELDAEALDAGDELVLHNVGVADELLANQQQDDVHSWGWIASDPSVDSVDSCDKEIPLAVKSLKMPNFLYFSLGFPLFPSHSVSTFSYTLSDSDQITTYITRSPDLDTALSRRATVGVRPMCPSIHHRNNRMKTTAWHPFLLPTSREPNATTPRLPDPSCTRSSSWKQQRGKAANNPVAIADKCGKEQSR